MADTDVLELLVVAEECMLAHLFSSGVRALAVSIVTGGLMIYATGGLGSPHATALVGVSIVGFFIFWIMFALVFAKRLAVNDAKTDGSSTDYGSHFRHGGRRREHNETSHDGEGAGEGGGDGGSGGD